MNGRGSALPFCFLALRPKLSALRKTVPWSADAGLEATRSAQFAIRIPIHKGES